MYTVTATNTTGCQKVVHGTPLIWSDLYLNVTPKVGVRIVASISLQIWSDLHPTVFTVRPSNLAKTARKQF